MAQGKYLLILISPREQKIIMKHTIQLLLLYFFVMVLNFCQLQIKPPLPVNQFTKHATVYNFPLTSWVQLINRTNDDYAIERMHLCSGKTPRCCSCESDCIKSKSCCIDALWNEEKHANLTHYLQFLVKQAKLYKTPSCIKAFPIVEVNDNFNSFRYWMITTCLENSNAEEIKKCHVSTDTPVLGSDHYIYRNAYCATCNNVRSFQLVTMEAQCFRGVYKFDWRVDFNFTNRRKCDFKISSSDLSNSYSRRCLLNEVNMCPKGHKQFDLCNSYSGLITQGEDSINSFKNYHCYDCVKKDISVKTKISFFCVFDVCEYQSCHGPNWSGLISIFSEEYCMKGQMYDMIIKRCVDHLCPLHYAAKNGMCIKERKNKVQDIFLTNFYKDLLKSEATAYAVTSNDSLGNISTIPLLIPELNITNSFKQIYRSDKKNIYQMKGNFTKEILQKLQRVSKDSFTWKTVDHIYVSSKLISTTKLAGFDPNHFMQGGTICAVFEVVEWNTSTTQNKTQLHSTNLNLWLSIRKENISEVITICTQYYLKSTCLQRELTGEIVVNNDSTITDTHTQMKYNINEYVPSVTGFRVCVVSNMNPEWLKKADDVEYYLSISFASFSIISYIWLISHFSFFKELPNLSSACTITLCSLLLLTDILFIIKLETYKSFTHNTCIFFSIALHWCILATFAWTAVIVFDLFSTFQRSLPSSHEFSTKSFIKRSIIAFTLPSVIVGLTTSIEYGTHLAVGYGINNHCWIQSLYARVGSFIIPLLLAFVFNMICLVHTACIIHRTNKKNQSILKSKNNVNIYKIVSKLILILGVIEGIGFIQITTPNENELKFNKIIGILYSVVRSLRGVLLWYVYIVQSNAFQRYKSLITHVCNLSHPHHDGYSSPVNTVDTDL